MIIGLINNKKNMKYFNRHECMGKETLRSIGEATTELYGLYDGFDYSDKIRSHEEMLQINKENGYLYNKILEICKDIDTYPKHDYDVTEH